MKGQVFPLPRSTIWLRSTSGPGPTMKKNRGGHSDSELKGLGSVPSGLSVENLPLGVFCDVGVCGRLLPKASSAVSKAELHGAGNSPRLLFPLHLHKTLYVGGPAQKTFAQLSSRADIGLQGIQGNLLMLRFFPHL
jgi:hypothetical protein